MYPTNYPFSVRAEYTHTFLHVSSQRVEYLLSTNVVPQAERINQEREAHETLKTGGPTNKAIRRVS